jgi:hypothetical protein
VSCFNCMGIANYCVILTSLECWGGVMSWHGVKPLPLHINYIINVTGFSCVWRHARLMSGTVQ